MQSWLEGRIWVGKVHQATGMTASLRIQSSISWFKHLGELHKSGLKLESVHQESPRSDVFRKGLPSHFWTRDNVRSILPELWRKRTGLLLSGPKSSFQMKVNFAFHLEIKVLESGGRVERHRIHFSPVWSFHSQWWFGLPCHLLVLVHCVFWSPHQRSHLPGNLRALHASSADKLYGDAAFMPTLPKVPKAGSMTMVLLCLIGQQTSLTWAPLRIYGVFSRGRWETPDPTMQMS